MIDLDLNDKIDKCIFALQTLRDSLNDKKKEKVLNECIDTVREIKNERMKLMRRPCNEAGEVIS